MFCVLIFFAKIVLLQSNIQTFAGYAVAPYVGAWIETKLKYGFDNPKPVAPYVGAWIETIVTMPLKWRSVSHPMWVRGLKQDEGLRI